MTSGQNIAPVTQLSAGSHTITVLYAGDANYSGSTSNTLTQTVNKATTTTAVPSALQNPASLNQSDQITATVSSSGGIPTGTANFFDGMNQIGNAVPLDQNGNAIFNPSFSTTGNHSIKAIYNGDNNFLGSTSPVLTLPVTSVTFTNISSSPNPSTFGQGVTFTALVSGGTDGVAVTFLDGSNPLGTGTVNSQQATFTTSSLSKGTHQIKASYPGDANSSASQSNSLTQSVTGSTPSITTLSTSPNPVNLGQQVNFTIAVTGTSGTPTGTVDLFDTMFGPAPFNILTLDASGQASFSTALSPTGNHTITAIYQGDATYMSSSGQVTQQVTIPSKKPTTTTLSSSANPAVTGPSITFTATVSNNVAGNPTGTVSFTEGGGPLGTASLSPSGQATLGPLTLGIGYHLIRAQ
ncbi:MAG: hypothetical protein DMG66_06750, partial [Acidobacteria bacterium]